MHRLGSEPDVIASGGAPLSGDVSIRVNNLHFTYGNAEVLHGLSFTVRRGEVTGSLDQMAPGSRRRCAC